ncbi:MAG: hypothetical protein BZ136_05120 [Methanosphaera sp. rholeuAM74]|nr:MAG: hypothetical protein BZ136_05120 [Methanosphaera sp. rholeuAM74]
MFGNLLNAIQTDNILDSNVFRQNRANVSGGAIVDNATNTTFWGNVNEGFSMYSSTVHVEGVNNRITGNVFDDGKEVWNSVK